MTTTASSYEPARVTLPRRRRHTAMLGMTLPQLVVVGTAGLVFVGSMITAQVVGAILTLPLWGGLTAVALVPVRGRSMLEWAPSAGQWGLRALSGQTRYRRTLSQPVPAGSLAIPGDTVGLRVVTVDGEPAGFVLDPVGHTLTATLRVSHGSFMLQSMEEKDARAAGWGGVLRSIATYSDDIAQIQVLERAVPDTGHGVQEWWTAHGAPLSPAAAEMYQEAMAQAGAGAAKHEAMIALTMDLKRAGKDIHAQGGGIAGAVAVMQSHMRALEMSLPEAKLVPAGWLQPQDLALDVRRAYDPAETDRLETVTTGREIGASGPLAIEEGFAMLESDSAVHQVLLITEWPRVAVPSGFLYNLYLRAGVRRTISWFAKPVPPSKAMREVRAAIVDAESDDDQRRKIGRRKNRAEQRADEDLLRHEDELVSGHGDLLYAGLIAVSVAKNGPTDDDRQTAIAALRESVSRIQKAAAAAQLEVAVYYGAQATGFAAAALPLGRGLL